MVSSGLFILPSLVYAHSRTSIIAAYFLAGILLLPSLFSKSELLTAMPKAGGSYFFMERSFGPLLGIFGGLSSWFSISLKSAFALLGIGIFIEQLLPSFDYSYLKIISSFICIFFVIVNLINIKLGSRMQNIMVIFILLACGVYVILGAYNTRADNFLPLFKGGIKELFMVTGMVFISYGGVTKIASIAEETENPSSVIPKAMFLSFFVVQVIYCLCVGITIGILGEKELLTTLTPLTKGAIKIGGQALGVVLSSAALAAFFTTAAAGILSASRIIFALGRDNLAPYYLSKLTAKTKIPYLAVITTGLFIVLAIIFLDIEGLVKTASALMILLFIFDNLAVIVMRESKIINYRPSFRSPFYPYVQVLAVLIYIFLIIEMGKVPLFFSLLFLLVSGGWYFIFARNLKRQSALMHLVERITARELVDTSLEEELKLILHKRDNIVADRFDHLITSCPILDLQSSISRDDFFDLLAETFSLRLNIDKSIIKKLLIERENASTTVIEKGLAIPHIIVEGENKFEIVVTRAKKGIKFLPSAEEVRVCFALAGTYDERNFHLRALMAIANIVKEKDFLQNFMQAKNTQHIRMLILSSTRGRVLK